MRVIHRAGKLGLGTAVVEGFAVASAEIVGVMDADFSHPPALVPRMLAIFKTRPRTWSSRAGTSRRNHTRLAAQAPTAVARGVPAGAAAVADRDAASGFFLIRREIARGTVVKAGGFKICLELIVRSGARRLVEMPYRFDDRELGASKMSLREAAGYLVQLRDLYRMRLSPRALRLLRARDRGICRLGGGALKTRPSAPRLGGVSTWASPRRRRTLHRHDYSRTFAVALTISLAAPAAGAQSTNLPAAAIPTEESAATAQD